MPTTVHLQPRSLIDVQAIKDRKVHITLVHYNLHSSTPAVCVNRRHGNAALSIRSRSKGPGLASSRLQPHSRRPRARNITTSDMSTDTSTTKEHKLFSKTRLAICCQAFWWMSAHSRLPFSATAMLTPKTDFTCQRLRRRLLRRAAAPSGRSMTQQIRY